MNLEEEIETAQIIKLMEAAEHGTLASFPEPIVQKYLHSVYESRSLIENAAAYGNLLQIPKALLTITEMTKKGVTGNTACHCAAMQGHISDIPNLEQCLDAKNRDGNSVLDVIVWQRHLDKVPKSLLTKQNMLKESQSTGTTPLHQACKRHILSQVPKELITQHAMLTYDKLGTCPLVLAITYDQIDQVPKEILTSENIMYRSWRGVTNIYLIAELGMLPSIPRHLLTEENLLDNRHSPAALATHFKYFPDEADKLLGLRITERSKPFVGEDWYNKNQEYVRHQDALNLNTQEYEIDIF